MKTRIKFAYTVIDERAGECDLPLLSVSARYGVVPRESIADGPSRAEDLSNYKVCRPGDIVLNRMSAYQGAVGRSTLAGLVSPDYMVVRPSDDVESRYFNHLFRSQWFVGQMTSRLRGIGSSDNGGVRTPRINPEDLGDISVDLPGLTEQRRIADFLDTETARIDGLATAQQEAKTLLLEHRAAKVFDLVTGADAADRIPSQLAWATSLPAIWQSVKLGHFARMGSGHTPSRSHPEWWEDCTIPWITTGEVSQVRDDRREVLTDTRECISEIGLANSAAELHPKDTVVLCRTASAGYSAVMGEDMATSQDFVTWTCGPSLDPFYLLWCLRTMRSDLLGRLAMGSTHKTIYVPDLQALRIPLPPLSEQRQIVAAIRASNTAIDTVVDVIDHQAELLAERRQALITAAVTGGITI